MEKTKFEKLKEYAAQLLKFNADDPEKKEEEENEEKFDAVQVKDGDQMVEYNPTLEIGSPVMIATGTGSTPAPDATYELSNGVIFITKDGLIESVTDTGKPEEEEKQLAPALELMSKEIATLKSELAVFKTLFEKVDFSKIPSKAEIEAFSKNVEKFGSQIGTVIEELSTIPVNVPKSLDPDSKETQGINFAAVANKFGGQ